MKHIASAMESITAWRRVPLHLVLCVTDQIPRLWSQLQRSWIIPKWPKQERPFFDVDPSDGLMVVYNARGFVKPQLGGHPFVKWSPRMSPTAITAVFTRANGQPVVVTNPPGLAIFAKTGKRLFRCAFPWNNCTTTVADDNVFVETIDSRTLHVFQLTFEPTWACTPVAQMQLSEKWKAVVAGERNRLWTVTLTPCQGMCRVGQFNWKTNTCEAQWMLSSGPTWFLEVMPSLDGKIVYFLNDSGFLVCRASDGHVLRHTHCSSSDVDLMYTTVSPVDGRFCKLNWNRGLSRVTVSQMW